MDLFKNGETGLVAWSNFPVENHNAREEFFAHKKAQNPDFNPDAFIEIPWQSPIFIGSQIASDFQEAGCATPLDEVLQMVHETFLDIVQCDGPSVWHGSWNLPNGTQYKFEVWIETSAVFVDKSTKPVVEEPTCEGIEDLDDFIAKANG